VPQVQRVRQARLASKGRKGCRDSKGPRALQGLKDPLAQPVTRALQGHRDFKGCRDSKGPRASQGLKDPLAQPVTRALQGHRGFKGRRGLMGPQGHRDRRAFKALLDLPGAASRGGTQPVLWSLMGI
jgi:hypothetical protein